MSSKKLILVITAEQAYIRSTGADETFSAPNDILFSAITDTYIPLVEMLGRLCEEEVPFKINLVLSPVLCEMLDDQEIQVQELVYGQLPLVIVDPEGFGVAAVGTYIPVGRGFIRAVGIADFCADYTVKLIKELLHAPEAAARKPDRLH